MATPDLRDPVQRAAYRHELQGVAPWVRRSGVGLAALGAVLAMIRAWYWRPMPAWIPLIAIVAAIVLMMASIRLRARYHARRMSGADAGPSTK